MEPSAVAARRTRASLALAVGGAIVLMAGVALIVTGEAMRLEHPVQPRPLIVPGLILVVLGFALGVSAAVTILLDAPTRLPSAHPAAGSAPGDPSPAGQVPDDPARYAEAVPGEVLSSFRLPDPAYSGGRPGTAPPGPPAHTEVVPGAALPPPGRAARVPPAGVPAAREPAGAEVPPSPWFRPGQPGPDRPSGESPGRAWAGEQGSGGTPVSVWPGDPSGGGTLPPDGELPGYSDAGWDAAAVSSSWPDPPAEPPHEIHHPVRR